MVRRFVIGVVASSVMLFGVVPPASAGATMALLLPQSTAFSMLGHSCGGIQEQAFATGFDGTSGYPSGDVYVQTRCGGSGRGGGYHSTTYSAWAAVTWDFTGSVVSSTVLPTAPPGVDPTFSAFDAQGNEVFNVLNAVNVLPPDCTVGNTAYCTYRAWLTLSDTFVPAPRVMGISPAVGPATGGTTVTIAGSGFTGATAVSFGATPSSSFTIDSDTSITAISPAGSAGAVDVTVTTPGGTSTPSVQDQFTYTAATACGGTCLAVGDASILEGDSGTHDATFAVTLSQPATTTVSVQYAVTGGTATGGMTPGGDVDFQLRSGTLTFTPSAKTGVTPISKSVTVPVYGDTVREPGETFAVTLSNPTTGVDVVRSAGIGTILNDDPSTGPTLGIGDRSVATASAGSQSLTFPVTLSVPATGTVTVGYAVTPGTATYSSTSTGGGAFGGKLSGTVTISAGKSSKVITVPIWPGTGAATDETFTITLTGVSDPAVTLFRATGTGTILGGP
ncbi:MAG TPA: IPT/TIG domain-containing protein [Acidimicrobiia bacterium]